MSRLESADRIEGIVGAARHETDHLGRAVSAEQRVYVLHSKACVASGIDLRECEYSIALDRGIDLDVWRDWQDQPVKLVISDEYDDLEPACLIDHAERCCSRHRTHVMPHRGCILR